MNNKGLPEVEQHGRGEREKERGGERGRERERERE